MKQINSLTEIIDNYDIFLLDLWGVIHDGTKLYPDVLETIKTLNQHNKFIIFLSNAPRRAVKAATVLDKFGIKPNMYKHVITSGEVAYNWLQNDKNNEHPLGNKYFYIGPDKDLDILDGLTQYNRTSDINQAEWILNVGFFYDYQPLDEIKPLLQEAANKNIKMLCINPDLIVIKQDGKKLECAGIVADEYIKLNGQVKYFGKPYSDVYDYCKTLMPVSDKLRILAVGDSLHTDIKGANNNQIDSLLISGGILKNELEINNKISLEQANKLADDNNAYPNHIAKSFL